jgi:hypothetical protein
MKAPMSMMWFVILGAVGFGIAGASSAFWGLGPLLAGALGGASLGLALKDWGRVLSLAILGLMGLVLGFVAGLSLEGLIANILGLDSESGTGTLIVATAGAVLGASLGLAFADWRTIVALAVAGAVGFGVGAWLFELISHGIPILSQLEEGEAFGINITIIGAIGGASLGAALGYLEKRKLAQERRPRVR